MQPTPPNRPAKPMTPTSSMDIPRPSQAKARRKRRIILGSVGAVVLIGITWGLSRLKPAAPSVDRNVVYIDTVKRGPMVRQVHGIGTLVPEDIRWIAARTTCVRPRSSTAGASSSVVARFMAGFWRRRAGRAGSAMTRCFSRMSWERPSGTPRARRRRP